MNLYFIIIILGLLIFISYVFNELFEKTKISNVLLLLLIGIIIGPISGIVTKDFFGELGNVFTTITLIVILFERGSDLYFNGIKSTISSAPLLTVINFVITVVIVSLISMWLLSIEILSAVFIGIIVSWTSSEVIIPIIIQLKMDEKNTSVLILESSLSYVLCLDLGYSIVFFSIVICSLLVIIFSLKPNLLVSNKK